MCLSSTLQNTLSNLISNYHSSISQYTIQTPLISVLQLNIKASNTSISYLTNPYNSTSLIHPVLLLSLIIQQVTNNTNHHYSYSIPFYIISYHHTILTILKANYTNKTTFLYHISTILFNITSLLPIHHQFLTHLAHYAFPVIKPNCRNQPKYHFSHYLSLLYLLFFYFYSILFYWLLITTMLSYILS